MFSKKGVRRNFAKFTGKHLSKSLFFNKVAGLRPATLLKKRLWHLCFPVSFAKFLKTPFLTEHLWWLLLFVCRSVFGELQLAQISLNFQTSYCNSKIRGLGEKLCVTFLSFSFWKELWGFKAKDSMLFVEQNYKL